MGISNVGRWLGKQAKFLVAVALAAVIGGVTTAGVMAAIPDTDGTIHACYSNGVLGRVKIIDNTTQTCGNNETAINWKQNGNPLLANPAGKNLSESVMVYWDLRNMDFTGTNFNVAKLVSSDLRGSNFTGATMTSALLMNTDLRTTTLTNTNMSGSTLDNANLAGLTLSGTNLYATSLVNTNLSGVTFSSVNLSNANLSGQNLSGRNLSTVNLERTQMQHGNYDGMVLGSSQQLKGWNLAYASVKNVDFNSANLAGAYLIGADFSGSDINDVTTWVDAEFGSATCPDGTLASDHGDTCIGHL